MNSALLNAALILVGLSVIGFLIKKFIWSGNDSPKSHTEYGRKFSSYAIFVTIISSTHFFTKNDLIEAVIKTSLSSILFALVGFLVGYAYSYIKKNKNTDKSITQDHETTNSFNMQWIYVALGGCSILIYFYLADQPLQTNPTIESKWIKIAQIPKFNPSNDAEPIDYYYIDEASKKTEGKYVYAFTGRDASAKTFLKYKMQADCTIPKYRIVESYEYGETISGGLSNPISEDKNYQKTMTNKLLELDPNYIYDGGWMTHASIAESITRMSNMKSTGGDQMAQMYKKDKAVLDFLCN